MSIGTKSWNVVRNCVGLVNSTCRLYSKTHDFTNFKYLADFQYLPWQLRHLRLRDHREEDVGRLYEKQEVRCEIFSPRNVRETTPEKSRQHGCLKKT